MHKARGDWGFSIRPRPSIETRNHTLRRISENPTTTCNVCPKPLWGQTTE
jgi:hypothetical protein